MQGAARPHLDGSKPPPLYRAIARYSASKSGTKEKKESAQPTKTLAVGDRIREQKNRFGRRGVQTREIGANLSSGDRIAARGVRATNEARRGMEYGLLGDDASVSQASSRRLPAE